MAMTRDYEVTPDLYNIPYTESGHNIIRLKK